MDNNEIDALLLNWDESEWEDDENLEDTVADILSGKKTYNDFITEKLEDNLQMKDLFALHAKDTEQIADNLNLEEALEPEAQTLEVSSDITPGPSQQCAPQKKKQLVTNKGGKNKTKKIVYEWKKSQFIEPDTEWKATLPPPPEEDLSPLDYFKKFIPDETIKMICEQTNIYAHQKTGTTLNVKPKEIEAYIGILLYTGVVPMAQCRLYWSNECRFPPVANALSRNRFEAIKRYLHLNDNTQQPTKDNENYDKLYKVRPLLESVRKQMLEIPPEEKQAVDEQVIPFKGRSHLKQYNQKKPHKWGFKVFTRASSSGIMHDFAIYVGKGTCPITDLGISGDIVDHLCKSLPQNQNFKVYFDNWFSSFKLVKTLKDKGIWSVGTIRSDRMGSCPLKSQEELQSKGRGAMDYRVEAGSGIAVVRWLDRKALQMISSYCCIEPTDTCKRFSKQEGGHIEVARPRIVQQYNQFMGGVDLVDMLVELYRIDIRSNKWYTRIIFWCLNVSVVTAWQLYRRHENQRNKRKQEIMPLLQFQSQIAKELTMSTQAQERKRGRPSQDDNVEQKRRCSYEVQPQSSTRFDQVGHFPNYSEAKKRCKLCKSGVTTVFCTKCEVHLCFVPKSKNCFLDYHKK